MRIVSALIALSFLSTLAGCWGPVDKGQPGVGTRITPQGHGAEWIKLKTELDGKSPVSATAGHGEAPAAAHGEAPASGAAPASAEH